MYEFSIYNSLFVLTAVNNCFHVHHKTFYFKGESLISLKYFHFLYFEKYMSQQFLNNSTYFALLFYLFKIITTVFNRNKVTQTDSS